MHNNYHFFQSLITGTLGVQIHMDNLVPGTSQIQLIQVISYFTPSLEIGKLYIHFFLVRVSAESLGRITDIAATHYSHISTAVTHLTSTCYIWGQCHGQSGKDF